MEVWLLACMMLVFFSLVEYTIILKKGVSHNRQLEKIKKDANYVKAPNGVSRTFYWWKFDVRSKSGSSLQLLISLLKLLNSRVITQVCRHSANLLYNEIVGSKLFYHFNFQRQNSPESFMLQVENVDKETQVRRYQIINACHQLCVYLLPNFQA